MMYNFAYRPADPAFAEACVEFAQKRFGSMADGYVLAPDKALPHVTVCDFSAEEALLPGLWQKLAPQIAPTIDLEFDRASARTGTGPHTGFVWCELGVIRTPLLVEQQEIIASELKKQKLVCHTGLGADYSPHLTFARVPQPSFVNSGAFFPEALLDPEPRRFYFSLGLSNENGVYQRQIYPAPA